MYDNVDVMTIFAEILDHLLACIPGDVMSYFTEMHIRVDEMHGNAMVHNFLVHGVQRCTYDMPRRKIYSVICSTTDGFNHTAL